MAESYEVVLRVISQKGTCATRHKIGDEWVIKDYKAPEGICLFADYPGSWNCICARTAPEIQHHLARFNTHVFQ